MIVKATLPFSNIRIKPHSKHVISGHGMGSVLLRTAGGGAGSSYQDIDDYISTTGINPYSRVLPKKHMSGEGLSRLSDKLSKLSVSSSYKPKRKNITMSY